MNFCEKTPFSEPEYCLSKYSTLLRKTSLNSPIAQNLLGCSERLCWLSSNGASQQELPVRAHHAKVGSRSIANCASNEPLSADTLDDGISACRHWGLTVALLRRMASFKFVSSLDIYNPTDMKDGMLNSPIRGCLAIQSHARTCNAT